MLNSRMNVPAEIHRSTPLLVAMTESRPTVLNWRMPEAVRVLDHVFTEIQPAWPLMIC